MIAIKHLRARRILLSFCGALMLFLTACKETPSKGEDQKEETVTEKTDKNTDGSTILFFGDSLTAGYGLEDTNDAFPSLIQQKIDSLGLDYTVVNAGLSGETTSGGRGRLEWVLEPNVKVFVLELGANDGLRGIPLEETKNNLQAMIDLVKKENPGAKIILAGMQIPPNMGPEYTTGFKDIFPAMAEKNDIGLIPFLLEDVGGIPALNQGDGIHPTVEGHKIVAENVWKSLKPLIN